MMTNLERAQVTELQIRLAGYGKLSDEATSKDDLLRGVSECREIRRQLEEIQARVAFRKMAS
jgi:hypothetical protein